MQIVVFCSSSNDLSSLYYEEAEKLGTFIGKENHTLIYGGANRGLMESMAKTAHAEGAFIIGILPSIMNDQASEFVDELFLVDTLTVRKEMIKEYGDIFVALPGGFGTLDELFDIVASAQIGEHDKKMVIVNSNHFYDPMLALFEKIMTEKFGSESNKSSIVVVNNAAECTNYLKDNAV